jgi:glycine/D-amino acid oxidase-like deaminating enzyme/nitrite reductase/ring-hydroxylating ferredoxin subunit
MRNDVKQDSPWTAIPDGADGDLVSVRPDVCVVGAGIAGLSTAYQLTKRGQRVLVLDDGPIGGGQTGRTTAHLSSALDDRFFKIERVRGGEGARLAAESHAAAIDSIEHVIAEEQIDCDFERVDGFLFVPPGESTDVLAKEEAAARRAGLDVLLVPRAPLSDFDTGPCLRFAQQGQLDPMRFLGGLARVIGAGGGRIVSGVHVTSVEGGKDAKVTLADGRVVNAAAVVVATNTPINDLVAIHTKQAPYISYAIALKIATGDTPHALYWDTGDPYHYIRFARDQMGERSELLIVGGEDHKTGQADDQLERFQRLESWARQRFPRAGELAYQWSGQVQETADGLAFIGRNPGDSENVFIATGDSGMGMTHGTIAGLLLCDLILKRENPWTELYEPSRKAVHAIGAFFRENANVAAQYGAWVTPGDVSSADQIRPGSGAVLRHGLTKLAVYRDAQGELHACSAVCPHLRAIVAWNDAEKTWDCPAHGSRFNCEGNVIEGPANTNLAPAEVPSPARG